MTRLRLIAMLADVRLYGALRAQVSQDGFEGVRELLVVVHGQGRLAWR